MELHISETKRSWTWNKCKFLRPQKSWLPSCPNGSNHLILLSGQFCSRWGMKCPKFPLFPMEYPCFSLKAAVWTEFVTLVELESFKFTLQSHPQFGFTASSWIQQKSLCQWKGTALMTLDLEEEPTHHPWERFSKVRAGSEHLQGLTLPCSHRVEIQLTQLEPFVLLQQLFRLMPLRIYYFMFWADTEAIFWSKMEFVLVSSSTVSP